MIRLLRFLAFFIVLVGLSVFVILPAVASPLLTQAVRDMGVEADDLKVTVHAFHPALLTGRASLLRVTGTNVALGRATVGRMDLTFGGVSIFDRSFQSLSGRLDDVVVVASGVRVAAMRVDVNGPAPAARATGHFDAEQSVAMVGLAAERAGIALDDVRLIDGGLQVRISGIVVRAWVAVEGGALTLRPDIGPSVVLLQPAASDPWRLTEAYVSPAGVTVMGLVDATRLAGQMPDSTGSR